MEKGQIVEVKIEDMSSEGQGIGKTDGFVVFVPGAVVGDVVKAELTKVKKSYGFSKLVEIVEKSIDRIDDFACEFFKKGCGGCQYGNFRYEAQLALKERQVRDKLVRIAGLDFPDLKPIIGMENGDNDGNGSFRYRNKAQFPVSTGGIITRKGGIVENLGDPAVGFYRAKSHDVVDCGDCYLQSLPAMAAADALRCFMEEDNITAWDPKWEKGLIRHLIVKTGFSSGEVMVVIVINGNGIPNVQKLVEMLDDAIYEVGYSLESVVLSIKKSDGIKTSGGRNGGKNKKGRKGKGTEPARTFNAGEIMGEKNVVVAGKPVIKDYVGDLEFEISPASFYQVNPVQMKRMYDKVKEYCGLSDRAASETEMVGLSESQEENVTADRSSGTEAIAESERDEAGTINAEDEPELAVNEKNLPVILDLYCGVGTIGLYCADGAEAIVGIETVKEAVIDANRNAVVNGITNARYICGKAEEVLPEYMNYIEKTLNDSGRDRRDNSQSVDKRTYDGTESVSDEGADGKALSHNNSDYNNVGCNNNDEDAEEVNGYKIDSDIAQMIAKANIAILDPPRAGCKPELLEAVAETGVDRIVYISCDPATLARDIKLLGEMGYEFVEGTPVDMFPWSGHVETVVQLVRKTPDAYIDITVDMDELDLTASEAKATYQEIKDYIKEKYDVKVSSLYIAQMKQKHGIIERENYNTANSENAKQPQCPPEKEKLIEEALRHFKMIS